MLFALDLAAMRGGEIGCRLASRCLASGFLEVAVFLSYSDGGLEDRVAVGAIRLSTQGMMLS